MLSFGDKKSERGKICFSFFRFTGNQIAKVAREKVKVVEEVKREFTVREQKLRESGLKTQAKLNTLRNLVNDTDSNDENMEPVWSVGRQTDSDPNLTTLEVRIIVLVTNLYIASSFFPRRGEEVEQEGRPQEELAVLPQPEG